MNAEENSFDSEKENMIREFLTSSFAYLSFPSDILNNFVLATAKQKWKNPQAVWVASRYPLELQSECASLDITVEDGFAKISIPGRQIPTTSFSSQVFSFVTHVPEIIRTDTVEFYFLAAAKSTEHREPDLEQLREYERQDIGIPTEFSPSIKGLDHIVVFDVAGQKHVVNNISTVSLSALDEREDADLQEDVNIGTIDTKIPLENSDATQENFLLQTRRRFEDLAYFVLPKEGSHRTIDDENELVHIDTTGADNDADNSFIVDAKTELEPKEQQGTYLRSMNSAKPITVIIDGHQRFEHVQNIAARSPAKIVLPKHHQQWYWSPENTVFVMPGVTIARQIYKMAREIGVSHNEFMMFNDSIGSIWKEVETRYKVNGQSVIEKVLSSFTVDAKRLRTYPVKQMILGARDLCHQAADTLAFVSYVDGIPEVLRPEFSSRITRNMDSRPIEMILRGSHKHLQQTASQHKKITIDGKEHKYNREVKVVVPEFENVWIRSEAFEDYVARHAGYAAAQKSKHMRFLLPCGVMSYHQGNEPAWQEVITQIEGVQVTGVDPTKKIREYLLISDKVPAALQGTFSPQVLSSTVTFPKKYGQLLK